MITVLVITCDSHLWALRPFAYLFNIYWSEMQPVTVVGYKEPDFKLPPNFTFYSAGLDTGPDIWSDGIIQFLKQFPDSHFVLMMDDYWLCRSVNHQAVASLAGYIRQRPDVLRIDLTADRAHNGHSVDIDTWGYLDIIETGPEAAYQWSTQACIVNRDHMLASLKPGMSPWQFELQGNELIPDGLRVLGTRQYPVRYVNALGMGLESGGYRLEHKRDNVLGVTVEKIVPEHVDRMRELGVLPDE